MFPRTQMSILQAMEAVMGLTFLLATLLSPSPFLAELMFCPRARAGRIGGPAQCKPTGTAPGFPMPGEGRASRKVALPREETEAQSLTASLLFLWELPHEADVGKLRSRRTLRSSPPLANPPGGWCTRRGNGLDGDNWSQMPQGHHQPVLDWPPSVLPAMWENVFLIIL